MEAERQLRKAPAAPKLHATGWSVVSFPGTRPLDQAVAVKECPTCFVPADCVSADRGLVLGVVEARTLTVGPQCVGHRSPAALTEVIFGELTEAD